MQPLVFESTRSVTPAEFAAWAEERARMGDMDHHELLHGRVVVTPPAGYPHGEITANVVGILHAFVRPRKLGKVFDSSQGFELPSGDTVEPDTSFLSRERWTAAPAPVEGKFLRVVPDLVVEILSTSTASRDRGEKKGIYERNGVREYWLVDARAREVVVFLLDAGRYGRETVYAETDRLGSGALAGLELAVSDILP
jgi:Uma2 family endonuclease